MMFNRHHKYVSEVDKIKMIQQRTAGSSYSDIAREFQRDPKTVKLWIERWENEQSIDVRQKTGARRSLSSLEEANLVVQVQQHQFMTAHMLKNFFGLQCTERAIQYYLNRNEINTFKAPVKPAIIPVNRETRVSFAGVFRHWTFQDWKQVIFTDESSFYNKRSCSRRIWRYRGVEPPEETEPTTYRRFRVNVWAAISHEKIEFITRVSNNFDSPKYLELLQQVVPMVKNNRPNMIWQHDNVRFHRTEGIEQYFDQIGVQKMKWPPQSPDLNPIENIWALISQKLNMMTDEHGDARTPEELSERVVDCAADISPEILHNMYASLPNRWQLVIEKNGGPTRY